MSLSNFVVRQPPSSDGSFKLEIPRLIRQQRHELPPKGPIARWSRISKACRRCRVRRKRCDGGKPTCSKCQESSQPCAYDGSWRDRLKMAADQVDDMKALLRDIRARTTDQDRQTIDSMLAHNENKIVDENVAKRVLTESSYSFQQDDTYEENSMHAQLDFNEDVDVMEDDLAQEQSSQVPGYVGKASGLQWLRQLQLKTGQTGEASTEHQSSSFYLDDNDLQPDLSVRAFALPSRQTAERLMHSYLVTVQATFPILAEPPFRHQFEQLYASPPHLQSAKNAWLGLLNLVFAIGRRQLDLAEEVRPPDKQDHRVYWSRAHVLGLEVVHDIGCADITQVQSTGLLALYLLSVGHVNRAWMVVGSSVRLAHALGLHVRNESRTSTTAQKEVWLRMWWGVYSLEAHIGTIVGRPSFVNESYCSAPLPLPLSTDQLSDEALVHVIHQRQRRSAFHPNEPHKDTEAAERSSAGSYLKSMIQLSIITQKAMTEIYSTAAAIKPWENTRQTVASLGDELDDWLAALPADLHLTLHVDRGSPRLERERLILNMQHIATKLLITRPCVCRLDSHERGGSEDFNKQTAQACVRAAKELANLLPVHSHVSYLYKMGPWWSVVHSLMQALVVLLLEMSYGTFHSPEDGEEMLASIKKLIRSLRCMGRNNTAAERAYTVTFQVLRGLASRLGAEISDLVWEDVAHSTVPSLDARVPNVESSQRYSVPIVEDGQALGVRDVSGHWGDFYDVQTGHMSMFYAPAAQPRGNAPLAGYYLQTYQPYDSVSNNPFMTAFDEENPLTFDERL